MSKLLVKKTNPRKNPTTYSFHRYSGYRVDKVSTDIVVLLPTTESGHWYILTIQDLLSKYSVVVPLKQAMLSEIAPKKVYQFIPRQKHGLQIKARIL